MLCMRERSFHHIVLAVHDISIEHAIVSNITPVRAREIQKLSYFKVLNVLHSTTD